MGLHIHAEHLTALHAHDSQGRGKRLSMPSLTVAAATHTHTLTFTTEDAYYTSEVSIPTTCMSLLVAAGNAVHILNHAFMALLQLYTGA